MKIHNIITCVNESKTYTEFVPLWSIAWKKITNANLIIGIVGTKSEDIDFVEKVSKYAEVFTLPKIKQIDSGIQAKVTRMILASDERYADSNCMIVDIDMIPLNERVLQPFEEVSEEFDIARWGLDHPVYSLGKPDYGKWPMDRTVVKNKFFKNIINPNNLPYNEVIQQWVGYKRFGRESVDLPFNIFSDESLLRALIHDYQKKNVIKMVDLPRISLETTLFSGRLDRTDLTKWDKRYILEKLNSKEIFEIHGIRPLVDNIEYYENILSYLNLRKEDII